MTLSPTARRGVVWTMLPDGAVLFSTETEVYFSLNPVGALVWSLLPKSLDEICSAVRDEYPDAPAEQIRGDIEALLQELESSELIEWAA